MRITKERINLSLTKTLLKSGTNQPILHQPIIQKAKYMRILVILVLIKQEKSLSCASFTSKPLYSTAFLQIKRPLYFFWRILKTSPKDTGLKKLTGLSAIMKLKKHLKLQNRIKVFRFILK